MANKNHNFNLACTDSDFTVQELKINVDGSTPPPGQKKRLYDLPNQVVIHNDSIYALLVKWANVTESDLTAGEWTGSWCLPGRDMKITREDVLYEKLLYKVAIKLGSAGSANIKISGNDYRSVFE